MADGQFEIAFVFVLPVCPVLWKEPEPGPGPENGPGDDDACCSVGVVGTACWDAWFVNPMIGPPAGYGNEVDCDEHDWIASCNVLNNCSACWHLNT